MPSREVFPGHGSSHEVKKIEASVIQGPGRAKWQSRGRLLVPLGMGAGGHTGDGIRKPPGPFVTAIPDSNDLRVLGVHVDKVKDVIYHSWIYSLP